MIHTVTQDVWDVKRFLIYCAETHPNAQVQDYVKRLYQSEFGGSHLLKDPEKSMEWLRMEINGLSEKQKRRPYIDPCFSDFCRMNLSVSKVISPELINRLFMESAKHISKSARFRFEEKLRVFWELCKEQPELFRFTLEDAEAFLKEYQEQNYPILHHSDAYRKAYEPAYRVITREYGRFLPLITAIEWASKARDTVVVALEGNCSAGKTTVAEMLATLWDCNVFHADDFFLPLEKRTPERMAEVGGNMDRERLREEILEPLKEGKPFSYRPFDCAVMALSDPVAVEPKKINIVEGSYCMHPELQEYYDVSAFLSIGPVEQEARILDRNGSVMLRRFVEEWIPMENAYFEGMQIKAACQMVF